MVTNWKHHSKNEECELISAHIEHLQNKAIWSKV